MVLALKGMGPLKSPGPDGFPAIFYQRSWNIICDDACELVLIVLKGNMIKPQMTIALLVLNLKNEKPKTIKHFRSISLCNGTFKLITKVRVNRLKSIMEDVVPPNQSSFIPKH